MSVTSAAALVISANARRGGPSAGSEQEFVEVLRLYEIWADAEKGSPEEASSVETLTALLRYETRSVRFGVDDEKGRSVGVQITTWQACGFFYAWTSATRAGRSYGASSRTREFSDEQARLEWEQRYVAASRRRAEKRGRR